MEAAPRKYKAKSTLRGVEGIVISWLVVAGTIFLVEKVHVLFYLPAIFILANRFLALNLYAHEGVHGNISDSIRINDFTGRYLCAFPTFTSFSRYKTKHLMHHRFLGSIADPDLSLYKDYPETKTSFLVKTLQQTLSGKMIYEFFKYYSDIPDLLRGRAVGRSDLFEFIFFHAAVLAGFAWAGVLGQYFWYWIVPLLICVPYFRFIGALQHAPLQPGNGARFDSRSVIGPKWMMAILLPVNINYHAAHHFAPGVPHYRLRELSDELSGQSWQQPYVHAVRTLFIK